MRALRLAPPRALLALALAGAVLAGAPRARADGGTDAAAAQVLFDQAKALMEAKLAGLNLQLNPRKTILQPIARGIDFVGHLIKPWRRITRRKTVNVALARLQDMPAADLHRSANSYFGLLRQATHSHHDRTRVAKLMLQRGHVVLGDMTKIYRKKGQ